MRLDSTLLFSDGQTISGTSTAGTKTVDLAGAGVAEGQGFVVARFAAAAHGCTTVNLQGCATSGGTFKTIASGTVSDTTAGAGVAIPIPQGCPRYLKVSYAGASMTGKVTCGITLQAPSPRDARIGDYEANV